MLRVLPYFSLKDSEGRGAALGNNILPARCSQERRPVRRIDWDIRLNLALSDMREVDSNYRNPLLQTFLNKTHDLSQRKVLLVSSDHRAFLLFGPRTHESSVSVASLIHKKSDEEGGSRAGVGDLPHSSCQQTPSLVRFAKWHEPPG